MTALFESYTDGGKLQFSGRSMAFTYHSKGSVMTITGAVDVGPILGPADLRSTGATATVAVSGLSNFVVATSCSTEPAIAIRNGSNFIITTEDVATVDYWVFGATDDHINSTTNTFGLQLFDQNGDLTYDSNYTPLRGVRFDADPSTTFGASTSVTGLASGKTYAWMLIGGEWRTGDGHAPPASPGYPWHNPYTWPGVREVSATSFAIEPVTRRPGGSTWVFIPPSNIGVNAIGGGILTIDVTGL